MQRCLVTGGAGLIGSHLCERLLRDGYGVICVDNLLTGRKENIQPFFQYEGFEFVSHDVIHPLDPPVRADYIFHLASPASPVHYQRYPLETALVNSVGTKHVLNLARRKDVKFLLASTSEVYGDPLVHPQPEGYWGNVNTTGVRSCYDESKRMAETLTMIYHRTFGCDTVIARIFNTYGPRMRRDDGRVVSNFITQALRQAPITIYGDGRQTRSLCYVDDMVEGLLKVMFSPVTSGQIFNLGNPHEVTMLDLATRITTLARSSSPCVFSPLPEDDPKQRNPDIRKVQHTIGWTPQVSLEDGLTRTLEWFRHEG